MTSLQTEFMRSRGLRPVADLAVTKPHGDRLRYMAGCRCAECRKANARYENERRKARRLGDWNGIVPAATARAHLLRLARQGVGRRSVGAATDIGDSILYGIRSGAKTRIRARTERKILAVSLAQIADHALINAAPTWRLIEELLDEGYTKTYIARRLGYNSPPHIQLGKTRITARNAQRVERLYRALTT